MSDMFQSDQTLSPPPRFFWRRLLALVVDWMLAFVLVIGLTQLLIGDRVSFLPTGLKISVCGPVTSLPPETLATIHTQIAPERIAGMKLCRASSFGLMPTAQLRIFFDARESEGRTQFKSISLALSPDLKEIRWAWSLSPALLVVLVLGSAALGSMGRRSPGKALLGLRLIPVDPGGGARPKRRWYLREVLRFLPFLIYGFGEFAYALFLYLQGGGGAEAILSFGLKALAQLSLGSLRVQLGWLSAFLLAVIWYFDWLTLRWPGQLRHDRIAGFWLRRG